MVNFDSSPTTSDQNQPRHNYLDHYQTSKSPTAIEGNNDLIDVSKTIQTKLFSSSFTTKLPITIETLRHSISTSIPSSSSLHF